MQTTIQSNTKTRLVFYHSLIMQYIHILKKLKYAFCVIGLQNPYFSLCEFMFCMGKV